MKAIVEENLDSKANTSIVGRDKEIKTVKGTTKANGK
jgi:hypothetical protein